MYLSAMTGSLLDYELLDFGNGRKLERFGNIVVDRPEVLAEENRKLSKEIWKKAVGRFTPDVKLKGTWQFAKPLDSTWGFAYENGATVWEAILKFGEFKHVGVFPEQQAHWDFISNNIVPGDRFLNLFGYTGCASLTAAKAGADVFHVDSSKSVVNWASKNATNSGIDNIHWVCEDALRFATKEAKRNKKYKCIILDPPVYGRGKKGEHWRIEDLLPTLIETVSSITEDDGFVILNTYSPKVSLSIMENICNKSHLRCIKKGWLNVSTKDNRKLELSRYIIAQKAH